MFRNEAMDARGELQDLSWPELRRQVASLATHLKRLGIVPGDRVCAYLPNTPQAAVAFLAVASVGAVWSVCSPDMGPVAVLDRFRQIAPKVLIAVDGQDQRDRRADFLPARGRGGARRERPARHRRQRDADDHQRQHEFADADDRGARRRLAARRGMTDGEGAAVSR